jgi:hypothetical protein
MRAYLGEDHTEQFTVETVVDGATVKLQPVHDPFVTTTVSVSISRWDHFLAIFKKRWISVEVRVRGSEGAQQAVMMLDPEQLTRDSADILENRRMLRESASTQNFNNISIHGR